MNKNKYFTLIDKLNKKFIENFQFEKTNNLK